MTALPTESNTESSTAKQAVDSPRGIGKGAKLAAVFATTTLIATFAAAYFAGQSHAIRQQSTLNPAAQWQFPALNATAAVTSEKFSMATGLVSNEAEGLFVLDHNSGLLQCSVMYPRLGKFLGLFTVNVQDVLGSSKGAGFMMATGLVDAPSSNNNPVASSVVYVLNTSTGQYACYYIPFNRTLLNSGKPQQGGLMLLSTGSADPIIDRDAQR
ncbi:hypothetical protein [Rhodopirellula sp. MGV]|uniref:hypothetical protein n=1 Tax=Rhodopirellula sp. MGV TaxID=2023130 RepID=UPI000B963DE5|nr:hypothetical protein [Rhodopirellula sp. MGV]OYP33902.1 hypothetical protein CGZ80_17090 [Rhodopirellula sp. MGV]PNY34115.1 hypothetical protein C2E31_25300 [Rhodopirellula baltica]